jgi:hypothetical protein
MSVQQTHWIQGSVSKLLSSTSRSSKSQHHFFFRLPCMEAEDTRGTSCSLSKAPTPTTITNLLNCRNALLGSRHCIAAGSAGDRVGATIVPVAPVLGSSSAASTAHYYVFDRSWERASGLSLRITPRLAHMRCRRRRSLVLGHRAAVILPRRRP